MSEKNLQIVLARRPIGAAQETDFRLEEQPLPRIGEGQFLVRSHYLSLDPYMRGRMNDAKSYAKPVALGEVMVGGAVGEVVESRHSAFRAGDFVVGPFGWQLYAVSDGSGVHKIEDRRIPLPAYLGVVGMPGVTAYVGLLDIGQPKAGETVVVSAASGAVGGVVGQIARIKGCRAVGIAGGREKCRYVVEELGFDACLDYKAGDLYENLKNATPQGIDVYFENVGGEIFDTVLRRVNPFARVPRSPVRAHFPVQRERALRPEERLQPAGEPGQAAGLHRLGPSRALAGRPQGSGPVGGGRPHQIPRNRGRRTGECPGGLHRHAQRQELRQAAGEADLRRERQATS